MCFYPMYVCEADAGYVLTYDPQHTWLHNPDFMLPPSHRWSLHSSGLLQLRRVKTSYLHKININGMYICFIQTNSCTLFKTHVLVCGMFGSQPDIPQTSTSGTHTHRQHTATYRINNWTKQTSRDVVTALSTKDGPLKMVKQLWPKHVGF
jgi:hypothetical protein